MVIIYRDKRGRFISKKSAKRRKPENVLSELREHNKSLRIVRGYHVSLRKPTVKRKKIIPTTVSIPPRRRKKQLVIEVIHEPGPFEEEPEEETEEEPEEELFGGDEEEISDWIEFEKKYDFLDGLDYLNDIFDYPDDEEWYEET